MSAPHPALAVTEPPAAQLLPVIDLLQDRCGLDGLWLYGSGARGETAMRPDSDYDLAALFTRPPQLADRLALQEQAAALAGREVDLVDLDRATPILAMQVLRHGRLLVEGDPRRRADFFVRTLSMYDDIKTIRRPIERRQLERFAEGPVDG